MFRLPPNRDPALAGRASDRLQLSTGALDFDVEEGVAIFALVDTIHTGDAVERLNAFSWVQRVDSDDGVAVDGPEAMVTGGSDRVVKSTRSQLTDAALRISSRLVVKSLATTDIETTSTGR